jgi:hypothetical protein
MGYNFGYKFISLTLEQVAERRVHLDHYANLANLSQIVVIVLLVADRFTAFARNISANKPLQDRPSSPQSKYFSEIQYRTWKSRVSQEWRTLRWRLGDEVASGYGTFGQWIGGILWSIWLLYLCVDRTVPGEYLWISNDDSVGLKLR